MSIRVDPLNACYHSGLAGILAREPLDYAQQRLESSKHVLTKITLRDIIKYNYT
jgi:hypothetical protein